MGGGIIALPIVTTSCSKFAKFDITVNTPEDINFGFPEARTWNASINNFKVQPDSVDWSISSDKLGSSLSIESTGLNTAKITLSPDNISDAGTFNYKVKAIAHKGKSSRTIQTKDIPLKIAHISFNEFTIESDDQPSAIVKDYTQAQTWQMTIVNCNPMYDSCVWTIDDASSQLRQKLTISNTGLMTLQTGLLEGDYFYKLKVVVHKSGYEDKAVYSDRYIFNIVARAYNIDGSDWDGRTSGSFTSAQYNIVDNVVTYTAGTGMYYVANNLVLPDVVTDGVNNYSHFKIPHNENFLGNTHATLNGSLTISSSFKYIGAACFNSQIGLSAVTINDGVETLDSSCFAGCTGITTIVISKTSLLKEIYANTFEGCTSLIKSGYNLDRQISRYTGTQIYYIRNDDTYWCLGTAPKFNILPESDVTGNITLPVGTKFIANGALSNEGLNIHDITGITFPSSLTIIMSHAFGNTDLSQCNINFRNVNYIGENAFTGCGLEGMLNIPESCDYIGPGAFMSNESFDEGLPNKINRIILNSKNCKCDASSFMFCGTLTSFECHYSSDPSYLWTDVLSSIFPITMGGVGCGYDDEGNQVWNPNGSTLVNFDDTYNSYSSEQLLLTFIAKGLDSSHWRI